MTFVTVTSSRQQWRTTGPLRDLRPSELNDDDEQATRTVHSLSVTGDVMLYVTISDVMLTPHWLLTVFALHVTQLICGNADVILKPINTKPKDE